MKAKRLDELFFCRDVLDVAPQLVGKILVRTTDKGMIQRFVITETEAYRGVEDKACHVSKGRTPRTEIMYHKGGSVYIYLIYGMYWMLNVVTGEDEVPQAVLIRGIEGFNGPGKLTRALALDKSFYGENMATSTRLWIEDSQLKPVLSCTTRIGIDYAGPEWAGKMWRWVLK
jgi:DNA-3-methyladenine glycosylase